ncbi:unnamed protein product, partial [Vitis vinifera]
MGLFLSELWFSFYWFLTQFVRWNLVYRYTFKDRLSQRYEKVLPGIDIFVCTADPRIEPPIMVINTVLSVMAYNYPSHKPSVYLSDDGGSDLTFYALLEASRFSKHWLPFCRKFSIEPRSPAAYFSTSPEPHNSNPLMAQEWFSIKVKLSLQRSNSLKHSALLLWPTTKLIFSRKFDLDSDIYLRDRNRRKHSEQSTMARGIDPKEENSSTLSYEAYNKSFDFSTKSPTLLIFSWIYYLCFEKKKEIVDLLLHFEGLLLSLPREFPVKFFPFSSPQKLNLYVELQMGLKYDCVVGDTITGLSIQCRGWKSMYFNPERKGFLGVAPTTLLQSLVQHKRWSEGNLQIFLSRHCPLIFGYRKVPLKLQLSYSIYNLRAAYYLAMLYYVAVPYGHTFVSLEASPCFQRYGACGSFPLPMSLSPRMHTA